MAKKLNPNEAPPGYVAAPDNVAVTGTSTCRGCAFWTADGCTSDSPVQCVAPNRKDGHSVIFIKRETEPLKPAALDARLTIRLPASVKAKAQRIGAAKVIAAIEAVQE